MTDAEKEQIKLTATGLNNVAVAFVIAGFIAPMVALSQKPAAASPDASAVAFSLLWVLIGVVLHLAARLVLLRIRP